MKQNQCLIIGPVNRQHPERITVTPVRSRTVWGSQVLALGPGCLRWLKRHVSVPCAATMPPGTTTGCGRVRAARPSSRGASRVGTEPVFVRFFCFFFVSSVINVCVNPQVW